MDIVFFGSPDFALPCLDAIKSSKHNIVQVICQSPKPAGRGKNITKCPVHMWSDVNNIDVFTPLSLRDISTISAIRQADVGVVVAYGLILPEHILQYFKYGCINLHPSLLPKWRGPSPIQYSILNGDLKTGVTVMQMDKFMDNGPILMQRQIELDNKITYRDLANKLSKLGAEMMVETLDIVEIEALQPIAQDASLATYSKKIAKIDALLEWNSEGQDIVNKIRAFNLWPVCYVLSDNDEVIRILEAHFVADNSKEFANVLNGTIIKEPLGVKVSNGVVYIDKLQKPGKKVMNIEEFLKGSTIKFKA